METSSSLPGFKHAFKYYKSRDPPPSFDSIVDLHSNKTYSEIVTTVNVQLNPKNALGLQPIESWQAYEFIDKPGLIYIRNPFTSIGQRYWIVRCLRDYTRKPNKLNVDAHALVPESAHWWDICKENNRKWVEKLRWSTLGYHHNWDTKVYSENARSDFPQDLQLLCKYIGDSLGFCNFNAQAAIVNFYHMDSTLSGHTDHSEQNLEAPLFSLSFGQSAVFLLGGRTLNEEPIGVMLHSGDIIVMSKEARLCYHGVPRILKTEERQKTWHQNHQEGDNNNNRFNCDINTFVQCKDESFFKPFSDYVECSRINVNVRQVLRPDQNCLD